jgi:hypothetical protein
MNSTDDSFPDLDLSHGNYKQADHHRGQMLGETKSVLPVITDKYKMQIWERILKK